MRLWLDEMISPEVARGLRRLGHDALGVQEPEQRWASGLNDAEQLAIATNQQRTLVSYNVRHFVSLSQAWAQAQHQHFGILLIHERTAPHRDPGGQIRHLARFLDENHAEDALLDQVVFLE